MVESANEAWCYQMPWRCKWPVFKENIERCQIISRFQVYGRICMAESPDGIGNEEEGRSWRGGERHHGGRQCDASCASGHDRADHRRLGA